MVRELAPPQTKRGCASALDDVIPMHTTPSVLGFVRPRLGLAARCGPSQDAATAREAKWTSSQPCGGKERRALLLDAISA